MLVPHKWAIIGEQVVFISLVEYVTKAMAQVVYNEKIASCNPYNYVIEISNIRHDF